MVSFRESLSVRIRCTKIQEEKCDTERETSAAGRINHRLHSVIYKEGLRTTYIFFFLQRIDFFFDAFVLKLHLVGLFGLF